MSDLNHLTITGNLTRDPELRYTPKGTAVCQFSVAVNRTWKNEAGEQQEDVSFVECSAFGRTAENIAKFFKKGVKILLEGRLKQETWDDKQTGQKRSKLGVIVDTFYFMGRREESGSAPAARPAAPFKKSTETKPVEDDSDPVPF